MSYSDSFTLHGSETAGENLSAHVSLETGVTWSKISTASSNMTVALSNLVVDHDTSAWDLYTYNATEPTSDTGSQVTLKLGSCTNSDSFGFGLLHRINASGNGYALMLVVNNPGVGKLGFLIYTVSGGKLGSAIVSTIGPPWVQNTTYTIRTRSSGSNLYIDYSLDGGSTWTNGATGSNGTTSAAGKSGLIAYAGISANYFTATNFQLYPVPATTIAPDDANIVWATDWKVSHTLAQTTNDGAFVRAAVTGTTSIAVAFDPTPLLTASVPTAHFPKFLARIDGGAWTVYQLPTTVSNITLATGLSPLATHTLELRIRGFDPAYDRWNTPSNVFQITGLVVDAGGATTTPTAAIALKGQDAIFYGDSITQGVNALTNGGTTGDYVNADDATVTYAQLLADSLNAEFVNRAYGGQALTLGTTLGNIPPCYSGLSTDSWQNQWSGQSILSGGKLSSRTGYVFINHGVNDLIQSVSAGTMATAVSGFLTALRAATPPACRIIYIVPFGQSEATGIINGFAAYGGTVTTYNSANGATYSLCSNDPYAILINLGSTGVTTADWGSPGANSYDGVHLTTAGHAAIYALLHPVVQTAIPFARAFNTQTDYLDLGTRPSWMVGANGLSVSLWAYLDTGWNTFSSGKTSKLIIGWEGSWTISYNQGSPNYLQFSATPNGTGFQTYQTTSTDPLAGLAGTWLNLVLNWAYYPRCDLYINGLLVNNFTQTSYTGMTGGFFDSGSHLTIGPGSGSSYDGIAGWRIADPGYFATTSGGSLYYTNTAILLSPDIANLWAGYPVEIVTLDRTNSGFFGDNAIFFQDALNFTGANPEPSYNGTINATPYGTTLVAGPPLFPPFAAVATPITQTKHTPSSCTLQIQWFHQKAYSAPVVFTPTISVGTFAPTTITLAASGSATGTSTLSINPGLTGLPQTYRISIANGVNLLPFSTGVPVNNPTSVIQSGYPVVDPTGEFIRVNIVDTNTPPNPVAPTSFVRNAVTVTVNGGTPRPLDIWLIDATNNYAMAPILDQWEQFFCEQDPTACTLTGSGWTHYTSHSWDYTFNGADGHAIFNWNSTGGSASYSDTHADTAAYSKAVPFAGQYQLYILEPDMYSGGVQGNLDGTTAAHYAISDGSTPLTTITVDQTQKPNYDTLGRQANFYRIIKIGSPFTISSGTFNCVLSNSLSTGRLYAGAIFLKYLPHAITSGDTVTVNFPDSWLTTGSSTLGQTLNATATLATKSSWFPFDPAAHRIPIGMNLSQVLPDEPCKPFADDCGQGDYWSNFSGSVGIDSSGSYITSMTAGSTASRALVSGFFAEGIFNGYPNSLDSPTIPWTIKGVLGGSDSIGVQLQIDGTNFPSSPVAVSGTFSTTILPTYPNNAYYSHNMALKVTALTDVHSPGVQIHVYPPECPSGWTHQSSPLVYNKLNAFNSVRRATVRCMNNVQVNNSNLCVWSERPAAYATGKSAACSPRSQANLVSIGPVDTNPATNADGALTYIPPAPDWVVVKVTHDGSVTYHDGQEVFFQNLSDTSHWPLANVSPATSIDPTYIPFSVVRNPHSNWFLLFWNFGNKVGNPGQMVTLAANHAVTGQVIFPGNNFPGIGMAYEDVITLANETNSDLHLNIPHGADNTFVTNLANLVVANLAVGRKCYIELSNEPWNTYSFQQPYYFWCKTYELTGQNGFNPGYGYGYRAHQVFQIFQPIWNADARRSAGDCLPLVNCQIGNTIYAGETFQGIAAAGGTPAMYQSPNPTIRVAVNGYHGFHPIGVDLTSYADYTTVIQNRLSARGMISLGAMYILDQSWYQSAVQGNLNAAAAITVAGVPFYAIPYVYEGGFDYVVPDPTNPTNAVDMAYQIFHDPLMYDFGLAFLSKMSGLTFNGSRNDHIDNFCYYTLASNAFQRGKQKWMVYGHDLETEGTGALSENPNPYSPNALGQLAGAVMQFTSTSTTAGTFPVIGCNFIGCKFIGR